MTPYARLEQRFHRVTALDEAADILYWDQVTYMPEGGTSARAEHLAAISVFSHELITAPQTTEWLSEADESTLDPWQLANLHEMRRKHAHANALGPDLVDALSRAGTVCEAAWREAKSKADFKLVKPFLAETLNLVRQAASAKAEKLRLSPYEALMDFFEPNSQVDTIDEIFADYAAFLPEFLGQVLEYQRTFAPPIEPRGHFQISMQKLLARRIMELLGFKFEHGRLDESPHPFSIGRSGDVRITTRYREDEITLGLMAVIHETGHALYDQQLPAKWRFQPVGKARGTVLHESQALIMEMQAARSTAFSTFLSALLLDAFPGHDAEFSPANLARLHGRVKPDFIRLGSDEVTYPAHVTLRYGLERAMISGALVVDDLPGAWNEGMKSLLGLDVPSDREGCLQDGHWYEGVFGYFPCYSLGAMTAAQLFEAACVAYPEIPTEIGLGRFDTLRLWLGRNVHCLGSSVSTNEVVERATGRRLDVSVFKKHLNSRYLNDGATSAGH